MPGLDNDWLREMRRLLGVRVEVLLDWDAPNGPVKVVGELLWFDEGGEVCLRRDDGFAAWAWPCLEIKEAPQEEA